MRKLLLVFLLLQIGLFAQLSNTNIWMMRGDTKTLSFNYNGNILNDSLIFVVKSSKEITAVRLISKTTYDNQINILFGVSSFVYVRLDAGDTDDLTLAKYYYDITRIHNGDSTTIFIGELNLQPDIGTPFDGTDVTGRVTTVSLANGTLNRELVWWNDSLNYWAPSGITFSSGGSVGDADSLGGIPASEYLVKSDSTDQRTFSDLKYVDKTSAVSIIASNATLDSITVAFWDKIFPKRTDDESIAGNWHFNRLTIDSLSIITQDTTTIRVLKTLSKNTNYTVTNSDDIIFITASTNKTVILPITGIPDGRVFGVKKIDSGVGSITITVESGGLIDGEPSLIILYQNTFYSFIKSGNDYLVL